MLLDLDNFKAVNDMNGHAAGDELLCWVVDGLRRAVRPMDSIGRLGGDEFAILAPGATESGAEHIATRARKLLSERVAVSTGVACFPEHGADSDELQRHADRQLYASKHGDAEHFAAGRRELTWAATLARAVDARMATPDRALDDRRALRRRHRSATGLERSGPRAPAHRGDAARHRQGRAARPHPAEAGLAERPVEFEEVKRHPETGAELINRVEGLGQIAEWVRHSHEHFDGSGYPDGLRRRATSRSRRASCWWRTRSTPSRATGPTGPRSPRRRRCEELRRHAGRQFDPRCVDALEEYLTDTGMHTRVERGRRVGPLS